MISLLYINGRIFLLLPVQKIQAPDWGQAPVIEYLFSLFYFKAFKYLFYKVVFYLV